MKSLRALPATKPAPRVLVVDDDPDSADLLSALLCRLGYEARPAHGGRAALAEAKCFRPEVALLDLDMPGMSGFELARCLRTSGASHGLRLVALTGHSGDEARERCRAAGFDAHLVKGVALEELVATLKSAA